MTTKYWDADRVRGAKALGVVALVLAMLVLLHQWVITAAFSLLLGFSIREAVQQVRGEMNPTRCRTFAVAWAVLAVVVSIWPPVPEYRWWLAGACASAAAYWYVSFRYAVWREWG